MSRSKYVWLVTDEDHRPLIVFTVKYHLADWLMWSHGSKPIKIFRFTDGYHRPRELPIRLNPANLELYDDDDEEGT